MFKTNFIKLCNQKGVPPTVVCQQLGLSKSAFSYWNETSIPREATLQKIADYFGVPVSYFSETTTQTIQDNHGIIGDAHASVTINNGPPSDVPLGEIEKELLSICSKLDMKRKIALLSKAYELLEE